MRVTFSTVRRGILAAAITVFLLAGGGILFLGTGPKDSKTTRAGIGGGFGFENATVFKYFREVEGARTTTFYVVVPLPPESVRSAVHSGTEVLVETSGETHVGLRLDPSSGIVRASRFRGGLSNLKIVFEERQRIGEGVEVDLARTNLIWVSRSGSVTWADGHIATGCPDSAVFLAELRRLFADDPRVFEIQGPRW